MIQTREDPGNVTDNVARGTTHHRSYTTASTVRYHFPNLILFSIYYIRLSDWFSKNNCNDLDETFY